ncbi:MAG: chemotaxis protein CheB [Steroidobacteraceae bacterium]
MTNEATTPIGVVAVGASAGGLQAYNELLEALPATTGMTFVIVQHLAAGHESFLATLLGRITSMPVIEVQDGPRMQANTIYVIPPNRTMVIEDGHLRLCEREPGLHLSVDIFFKALALSHGPRAIGVVLSGTGSDGMKGIEAIKTGGGTTFAQDQSAQQSGMPTSAINTGCVDFVMSPRNIALEIAKLASVPELAFGGDPVEPAESVDAILGLVRERVRIDFSQYKENTLHRRIRRRMALSRRDNLDAYAALLHDKPEEVEALAQDILISVTSFFRDPESFEALKSIVFPRLLVRDSTAEAIRIWVVGCSTGEEAYSLAIALLEAMDEAHKRYPLAVFGTDVNAQAIERARRGWFPKSIAEDVSKKRLERFFSEVDGGYSVNKWVRELCIFAPHNAITDPPFSRMDLVSCRNLLIYFQGGPQRKLLPLLHYALKPGGTLFLGASESINNYRDLFDQEDARNKIYIKRAVSSRVSEAIARATPTLPASTPGARKIVRPPREPQNDRHRTAEMLALKYFVPAGVLVDADGEILQFRGDTSPYLTQADGRASLNLLKIAREGLFVAIRAGLQHAVTESVPLETEGVIVKNDTGLTTVSLVVIPVVYPSAETRCCWIFFDPNSPSRAQHPVDRSKQASTVALDADTARQISVLTDALMATRDHLEATIQEQESANADLQAANEEVQSSNEELQSTNEELETSKEEIQSSNEELSTVNDELRLRNEELDRANNDLLNLFSSVRMAVVMVWPDLRIRRSTPLAEKLFNIRPVDVGRSITHMHHHIDIEDFPALLKEAIEHGRDVEKEVQSADGYWYLLRLRPYRTQEGSIDGAIVLLVDINTLAQTQESLRRRVAELAAADRHRNEFLAVLAHELRNPLAPLRNAVQILRRAPGDAAVSSKARDLIDRQVHHMSRLVGDLLDAARAQNGQIQLQRTTFDLRSSIEHVTDMMRPVFESKRQSLRVAVPEESVWVDGDSIRLEQIFTNLLNNSNKFTPEGGDIQIILSSVITADEKAYAVAQVIDNGDGIDVELVPRLFELFTQADRSLAHSQGGLGIGLSLVRTLVEMHGGQVAIRSGGRGRGSTFEVRVPMTRAPSNPSELAPAAGSANGRSHRLLIVDDNKDMRESSCELLAMAGFEVTAASTGREALEIAPVFKPTAILLDVGLPDLSGYDVARRLRGMPQFASTLLIAITGYDTQEAHVLSAGAGFDHHISKPVSFDKLQALLNLN